MATATQNTTYLQQYLNNMKANQPELSSIGSKISAAQQNMQVPDQSKTISQANKVAKSVGKSNVSPGQFAGRAMVPGSVSASEKAAAQGIVGSFQNQITAANKQAENQGDALELKGQGLQNYIGNLRSMSDTAVSGATESLAAWNRYTDNADQYLQDSAARMASVTADIKGTIEKYAQTNDAALAHSLQAGVYGWKQANKSTERAIAERYGTDSAEYRDYLDAKNASVAGLVSDLTAKAWDRTQAILNTGVGALASVETQLATDVNLAQKNALDAYEAAAAAGDQYRLQTASFLMTLQAAENSAWGELADWINQATVPAVDAAPMFAQLLELDEQSRQRQKTESAQRQAQLDQTRPSKPRMYV
jgi:hypothetical protein